ncbi:hypothetical protein [Salidesulfovibrio brasiliensis]|uniref:hypothetical protein n=1 Tax=Salidesulfovibrio brasiliensis TaxID=221711 RepID=UPI000A4DC8B6|nr:hypothetical protein [Salidesulfovibrio brasiliensis]
MQNTNDVLAMDRRHAWHPYASVTEPLPVYDVVSASGVRLTLADGRELVDGMAHGGARSTATITPPSTGPPRPNSERWPTSCSAASPMNRRRGSAPGWPSLPRAT